MEIEDLRDILPLFLNHSHAAVAIKDLDGRYLFANDRFARYAGVPLEDLLGNTDQHLLSASAASRSRELEQVAASGGHGQTISECLVRGDKTLSFLTARFPVFDDSHQTVALGVIAMDDSPPQGETETERALREAQHTNAQLRSALFTLEELASTDRLTNAWNRRRFEETIEAETHRSARYGHPLAMLLIDVDHFKRINDEHGHVQGDRVLVEVSSLVRSMMRKSDSLTRWGGEEFIVLMPNTGLGRAQASAQRMCEAIRATQIEAIGRLTVSIGVAEYLPVETPQQWLERVDRAMYAAKQSGRDRVVVDRRRSTTQRPIEHLEANFVQLVWKESFLSGDSTIDRQHETLFAHANELLDTVLSGRPRDEIRLIAEGLLSEVTTHFRDEEWILSARGFRGLDAHRTEHAELLARGTALLSAFEAGTIPLGEMFQFLAHELIGRHILGADREYFPLTRMRQTRDDPLHADLDRKPPEH